MAESIFTSQVPANQDFLEGVPVTLGTVFTVAVNGTIDGGRWRFPNTLPVGTVQWLLYRWTSETTGVLLAQENFVAPVAGVYNTVNATAPVPVVPGQRYVTAVFTPNGRYVLTGGFFSASGVVNGNLTAPQTDNITPARNGKFNQNAFPLYPNNSFNATCYFADVLFTASSAATAIPIGLATESDVAFPITAVPSPVDVSVGLATEVDTALPILPLYDQGIPLGMATEIDTALPIGVRVAGETNPFYSGPCSDWEPLWCEPLSAEAMAVTGDAVSMATEVLWSLSGQRFGLCEVTLRPCREDCAQDFGSWGDWWSGAGYSGISGGGPRPWWWDGVWANVCGGCTSGCSCTSLDMALLPAPTREVLEVRLDGLVMNPSAYRVDENRKLVRTDGGRWPTCQRMDLSDDEPGTWSVRISVGEDVPMLARRAVAQLATEFARDCVGEECTVPYNVTSFARQGVTLQFGDPRSETVDPLVRLLGLRMVRLFLATYNPEKLMRRGKTYDVDRNPRPWRRVNTS